MSNRLDLVALPWRLAGWMPYIWMLGESMESGEKPGAEVEVGVAPVPGSVQRALRNAGLIPDWNLGFNARECEWVENRHWCYSLRVPALPDNDVDYDLVCEGLDGTGWILWDGRSLAEFPAQPRPHAFRLPRSSNPGTHTLSIVFDCPPRFLGQFGHTSRFSGGKPRFYYTWDWVPRLVQTGITGAVTIQPATPGLDFLEHWTDADPVNSTGKIRLRAQKRDDFSTADEIVVALVDEGRTKLSRHFPAAELVRGVELDGFPVELWQPNGCGRPKLYDLIIQRRRHGVVRDEKRCKAGFRHLRWLPCQGAPPAADPWLLEVNGQPVFVQGINWTPIRPHFADVTDDDYRQRIAQYRDIGVNMIRVWGGAPIEREILYELCDEQGIMVWQEFPLCSSGVENMPPTDEPTISVLMASADYYLRRLTPHVSLTMWCGGNELQRDLAGNPWGSGKPCTTEEPLLAQFAEQVRRRDPSRRFVPASASGPREFADEENYGRGLHWDVHGPWNTEGPLDANWRRYWDNDDALFRSEVGCPGASPAALIREFAGDAAPFPCSLENPLWRYPLTWWNQHKTFVNEHGREPSSLEEYVAWSQQRQAVVVRHIAANCKQRFPACGGVIVWMGHDCFPCTANTSILDFHGAPKPAALALKEVFGSSQEARYAKQNQQYESITR